MCTQLPAFHALTACDSVSTFFGFGKMKAWKDMKTASQQQWSTRQNTGDW